MSVFGSGSPLYVRTDITNEYTIDSATPGVSSTMILISETSHNLGVGMYVHLTNMENNNNIPIADAYGYIIAKTLNSLTVDVVIAESASFGDIISYVPLAKSLIEPNFIENNTLIHTSIINGKRHSDHRGNYSSFSITLHLLKYSATERTRLSKLFIADNGKEVFLKLHSDGSYFEDINGDRVPFLLKVQFAYLSRTDFRDLVIFTFTSLRYTDISKIIL